MISDLHLWFQIFLAVFVKTDLTTAFLLGIDCVAPAPCVCREDYIRCSDQKLSQIPNFTFLNGQSDFLFVYLYNNQLTTIPEYTFSSLSIFNATAIDMELDHNYISEIDSLAFEGVENTVTELNLRSNNLTELPPVLSELTILDTLDVSGNPLTNLNSTIMLNLGLSLEKLSISVELFSVFPKELRFLKRLKYLLINNIPFPSLNDDAFNGLSTLTEIVMSYSKLEKIPAAICHIETLRFFTFTLSTNLKENGSTIFDGCDQNITSLLSLTLDNNNISVFPAVVFKLFPNLTHLSLRNNNLQFIKDSSVMYNSSLTSLDLSGNRFLRIPAAVNRFLNLQVLYFESNQVVSLEDYDVFLISKLRSIYIRNNPLAFVSVSAFDHNPLLEYIDFDNTKLSVIPQAVLSLKYLRHFYMYGNPLECSCSKMAYLKSWDVTTIYLGADCDNGGSVKLYIMIDLPSCP